MAEASTPLAPLMSSGARDPGGAAGRDAVRLCPPGSVASRRIRGPSAVKGRARNAPTGYGRQRRLTQISASGAAVV